MYIDVYIMMLHIIFTYIYIYIYTICIYYNNLAIVKQISCAGSTNQTIMFFTNQIWQARKKRIEQSLELEKAGERMAAMIKPCPAAIKMVKPCLQSFLSI